MGSPFSRLVCFNYVCNEVFTSFLLENNIWTHDKLDVPMHEKNVLWEVATPKYTVYKEGILVPVHHLNVLL